jgi:ABC-type multidrug transport system fused ATPase/permease subunit
MDSSRVLVLEMGRLVEFDSPLALLQDHASMFYSLVHKED